ncbi:hypothetical protein AncyloWKF20_19825 [Ancylobacter sp. WKF20]|uniref:hypothetical protein n=1 Tax=Ancylobacter sp. WKF20 TaxID=3039801 RepID=UPI00243416E6|nr:hypothetical protein [Ancylobacter sp. WKF20]WGD29970.1 hypothetical protein AncyloWKF20_19825 [Ancylobacter sp. WKF20]
MALFPLSSRATSALAGGLGAGAGFLATASLEARYPAIAESFALYAILMFLASFFFISVFLDVLNRLNARRRGE